MSASAYQFKFNAQPLTEDEQRFFGIFVSHANSNDSLVNELCEKAKGTSIHFLHDGEFLNVGDNFNEKILKYIKCYGCVVIVTKESLCSDWVQYECGYFSQSGHRVIIWDPDRLLTLNPAKNDEPAQAPAEEKEEKKKKGLWDMFRSQKEETKPAEEKEETGEERKQKEMAILQAHATATALLNSHLTQYMPVYHTAEEVIRELQDLSVYADLYTDACLNYSVADFQRDLRENVSTVMVRISSPALSEKKKLFTGCKLSTLVVNFGMYYEKQGDGIHCWSKRTLNMDGTYTAGDDCLLPDGKCKHSGQKCAMYSPGGIDRDMKQCVILNHTIPSGRYFDQGEEDYNGQPLKEGTLTFYVPVHKHHGTEFKFIVDAPNQATHTELMRFFEKLDLDPTVSDSLNGWRIYLSIPSKPYCGFFRLEDDLFHNNFLCPRSATVPSER